MFLFFSNWQVSSSSGQLDDDGEETTNGNDDVESEFIQKICDKELVMGKLV